MPKESRPSEQPDQIEAALTEYPNYDRLFKTFLPKEHEKGPDVGRAICWKAQNVSEPPDQTCRTREEYIMINWA